MILLTESGDLLKSSLKKEKSNIFYTFRYELYIFFFLAIEFVFFLPDKKWLSPLVVVEYVKSYDGIFGNKMLLGSIIKLFTDYVTVDMIFVIAVISFIVMIILISVVLGGIIRKSSEEKEAISLFTVLFLLSYFGIKYLLGTYIGRIDVYWIIFTVISLTLIRHKIFRWLVPVFCLIMMSVHHGYILTYMPALCIPILYEVYKSKNDKVTIIFSAVTYLTLIISFLYFNFLCPKVPFDNAVDYTLFLQKRTDGIISSTQIFTDYFADLSQSIECVFATTKSLALKYSLFVLFTNLPIIVFFNFIFVSALKQSENVFKKIIFIFCMCVPLLLIPGCMLGVDWNRWFASVINSQFIIIFYLLFRKEKVVTEASDKVVNFTKEHSVLFIFYLIFLSFIANSKASGIFFYMLDGKNHMAFFRKYLGEYTTPFSQNAIGTYYSIT